tara:strand:+ start:329 stop:1567 length:1239 start_codon:yes stop_codon:yes gene_type:complete
MSFKKFGENDFFLNTMRAYPSVEFFIFDSKVYWNNIPDQSGSRNVHVRNVPPGHVSLYEYNIDRPKVSTGRSIGDTTSSLPDTGRIYPWISKDTAGSSFKTVSEATYETEFRYGDILTSSYPLSASITREYIPAPYTNTSSFNAHYTSLRNRLNFYGIKSQHFKVSSSYGDKNTQVLNLISIPSIFFGSQIKPGSMSLKWYFTGSLIGELQDEKQDGVLVQVGPYGSTGSGSVAGVALYDEGFVILTGSWSLNSESIYMISGSGKSAVNPKWIYFGAGAGDDVTQTTAGANYVNASFNMSFKGTTETQALTMLAHARRGEVNYSTNPSYIEHGQDKIFYTSSHVYEEPTDLRIKNFVSSAFDDYTVDFKRQVYISRVCVYDKKKNLIGVATLSNPILKEEGQDYTFKLKLDI